MSSRLSQAVGVELPLSTLFARPVLADLAASIVEVLSRSGPQDLPPIAAVSRHEPLVLSFAQQRLWFLAQLDEGSTHYHIPLALRLRGVLDRSAWQRSLDLFATGRKSWLFSDTVEGARASAVVYSLMLTCRASRVEPLAWLRHVLTQLPQRAGAIGILPSSA
ncbi:hypothetical protein ACVIVD_008290 [Bradyrhizobium liaoningense]